MEKLPPSPEPSSEQKPSNVIDITEVLPGNEGSYPDGGSPDEPVKILIYEDGSWKPSAEPFPLLAVLPDLLRPSDDDAKK